MKCICETMSVELEEIACESFEISTSNEEMTCKRGKSVVAIAEIFPD